MRIALLLFSFLLFSVKANAQCFSKVSGAYGHVLALDKDSSLWHWGGMRGIQRTLEYPTLLDSSAKWIDISTGNNFQMAIQANGTLWAWGDNGFGQLGLGNNSSTNTLTQVGTDDNWTTVSCGEFFTLALKTDGTSWIWGRNNYGQLGNGTTNRTNRNAPAQLGTDTDWIEISAGKNHSLLRKSNNSAWFVGACYGNQPSVVNQVGSTQDFKQLGASNFTDYAVKQNGTLWRWNNNNGSNTAPQQVGNQNDWLMVNCSHTANTLLLKNDSTLWVFGNNQFGELGTGNQQNIIEIPVMVEPNQKWISIFSGNYVSYTINKFGQLFSTGRNASGEFGNGINRNKPHQVLSAEPFVAISTASATFNGHTLAIDALGDLYSWGQNNDGQLGIGSNHTHQLTPTLVESEIPWKSIGSGFQFSAGVKQDSSLWSWGRNGQGQLGLAQGIFSRNLPTRIGSENTWKEVVCGGEFALAIQYNGTLWAWGANTQGQLGIGSTGNQFTPVQVGSDTTWIKLSSNHQHTLALKADSTLWSWGNNQHGRLGRFGSTNTPQQVGEDKWIAIAAGGLHSLGIKADSSVWAWGYNLYAQLGDNSTQSRSVPTLVNQAEKWIQVSAGHEHSLALKSDSSLWAWGRNGAGQLSDSVSYVGSMNRAQVPTLVQPGTKFTKVAGGAVNSLGITQQGNILTWGDAFSQDFNTNRPQLGVVFNTFFTYMDCPNCINSSTLITDTFCLDDVYEFNNQVLVEPGVYEFVLTSAAGCDSTLVLNLSLVEFFPEIDIENEGLIASIMGAEGYQWYNCETEEPIPNAVQAYFEPPQEGAYKVEVTQNGCSYFSDCFEFSTIGVTELSRTRLKIYPNPARDYIIVQFKGDQEVFLMNTLGVVLQQKRGNTELEFDISALSPGLYLFRAGKSTQKFIKQH